MKKNLDIMKPLYRGQILSVSWPFVILRFHCTGNHLNTYSAKSEGQNYQYCIWLLPSLEIKTCTCYLLNFLLFEFFKSFLLSQIIDAMGLRQRKIQTRPGRKISDGIKICHTIYRHTSNCWQSFKHK